MSTETHAYNVGPLGAMTLETWLEGSFPSCLVVQLPTTRCIGEDEFLLDVARRRAESRGFKDAIGRHFISRRFGVDGTVKSAEALFDAARAAAEITDDFFGVDAIDMTEWLGAPMRGERWHAFVRHIQTSSYTDFVFIVRTAVDSNVEKLVRAISGIGCLPVEVLQLYAPTSEMLAQRMCSQAMGAIDCVKPLVCDCFEGMREAGQVPNYTLARMLASKAAAEVRHDVDPVTAVLAAFGSVGMGFENQR